jgi:hypothetical protein
MAAHGNRSILGPVNPYDDGQKANYVPGGLDTPQRSGVIDGDTSAVTDQGGVGTAAARAAEQDAFRSAQAAAGLVGADAGAGGTIVAAAGQAVTSPIPDSPRGDLIGQGSPLVMRADGGDDPAGGAYGKAVS